MDGHKKLIQYGLFQSATDLYLRSVSLIDQINLEENLVLKYDLRTTISDQNEIVEIDIHRLKSAVLDEIMKALPKINRAEIRGLETAYHATVQVSPHEKSPLIDRVVQALLVVEKLKQA